MGTSFPQTDIAGIAGDAGAPDATEGPGDIVADTGLPNATAGLGDLADEVEQDATGGALGNLADEGEQDATRGSIAGDTRGDSRSCNRHTKPRGNNSANR